MVTSRDESHFINQRESDIRWSSHESLHDSEINVSETKFNALNGLIDAALDDHHREHEVHQESHKREHEMSNLALLKAENSMDRRLEAISEFRDELNKQAQNFLTRDAFDKYIEDVENKFEIALQSVSERQETLLKSIVNTHNADYNSLRELVGTERENRKSFEGSINTWKWIAGFLGASGVAGVVALFITRTP